MREYSEVFSEEDKTKEGRLYIIKILNDMEEQLEDSTFEKSEELEGEEYENFCDLKQKLVKQICKVIREAEMEFDFAKVSEFWGNNIFWREIETKVKRETEIFLKMKVIRQLEDSKRCEYYKRIFDIQYKERENLAFACEELKEKTELVELLFRLIVFCEKIIFNEQFSKRRFDTIVYHFYGLEKQDLTFLWQLFQKEYEMIEKIALFRSFRVIENSLITLEGAVNRLDDNVYEIWDELNIVCDCVITLLGDDVE